MYKAVLSLALVLTSQFSQAQSFFEGDPIWYLRAVSVSPIEPGEYVYSRIARLGGQDTIEGRVYYEVEFAYDPISPRWQGSEYRLRESGDTVYNYDFIWNEEQVYMLRNWVIGTSFELCRHWNYELLRIDNLESAGRTHREYVYYEDRFRKLSMIENVGYSQDMFVGESPCLSDQGRSSVNCLFRNGELIYMDKNAKSCFEDPVIISSTGDAPKDQILERAIYSVGEQIELKADIHGRFILLNGTGQIEWVANSIRDIEPLSSKGIKLLILEKNGSMSSYKLMVF